MASSPQGAALTMMAVPSQLTQVQQLPHNPAIGVDHAYFSFNQCQGSLLLGRNLLFASVVPANANLRQYQLHMAFQLSSMPTLIQACKGVGHLLMRFVMNGMQRWNSQWARRGCVQLRLHQIPNWHQHLGAHSQMGIPASIPRLSDALWSMKGLSACNKAL